MLHLPEDAGLRQAILFTAMKFVLHKRCEIFDQLTDC